MKMKDKILPILSTPYIEENGVVALLSSNPFLPRHQGLTNCDQPWQYSSAF
jgi:hypothetical protein